MRCYQPCNGARPGACSSCSTNFEPERLQDALGAERCAFGMPFVQANFDGEGKLKASIGAGGQKTRLSQQCWVDIFNAAGLPAVLEADMLLWLRCHSPLCVAFESVSVAGERRGGGASWGEAMVLARGLHECFALIKGLGLPAVSTREDAPQWLPGVGGGSHALVALTRAVLPGTAGERSRRMSRVGGRDDGGDLAIEPAGPSGQDSSNEALARVRGLSP